MLTPEECWYQKNVGTRTMLVQSLAKSASASNTLENIFPHVAKAYFKANSHVVTLAEALLGQC